MKKLVVAVLIVAIIGGIGVGSVSAVDTSNIDWGTYFDTSIFGGDAFTDVPEKRQLSEEEPEKDWLEHEIEMFPPGWFNETPSEELTNFPPEYFDETPKEEYTDKQEGWFEVGWGIKI